MTDMKSSFYVSLLLIGWATIASSEDLLSRIDDVLRDDVSLQDYGNCFLEIGKCSSDARAMRRLLPEFISTSCAKCSEKNKLIACKVLYTLQEERHAELWAALLQKYDSNNYHIINLDNFMQTCRERQWIPF